MSVDIESLAIAEVASYYENASQDGSQPEASAPAIPGPPELTPALAASFAKLAETASPEQKLAFANHLAKSGFNSADVQAIFGTAPVVIAAPIQPATDAPVGGYTDFKFQIPIEARQGTIEETASFDASIRTAFTAAQIPIANAQSLYDGIASANAAYAKFDLDTNEGLQANAAFRANEGATLEKAYGLERAKELCDLSDKCAARLGIPVLPTATTVVSLANIQRAFEHKHGGK
jgi:hypothetical protein